MSWLTRHASQSSVFDSRFAKPTPSQQISLCCKKSECNCLTHWIGLRRQNGIFKNAFDSIRRPEQPDSIRPKLGKSVATTRTRSNRA
jgi:hypothetical protein